MTYCPPAVNPLERTVDVAKAYNNLDGWMRDVRNALRDGDARGYDLALLLADVDELLEQPADDDADLPDTDSDAGGESEDDMDLRDAGHGGSLGGAPQGHGPLRGAPLGGPATLDGQALSARAHQLAHEALPGRTGGLVRTGIHDRDVRLLTARKG